MNEITQEALRAQLEQAGFTIYPNHKVQNINDAKWVAVQRLDGLPDCECNDKPPSLFVYPFFYHLNGAETRGVEFEVNAKMAGRWYKLTLHEINADDCMDTIERARRDLSAAWGAIAEANIKRTCQ